MTWLQIAYIVGLYFLLAEALFQYIDEEYLFFSVLQEIQLEELTFSLFLIACYLCWPILFVAVRISQQHEKIERITRELVGEQE